MRRIRAIALTALALGGWHSLAPALALGQDKEPKKQRDLIARWEIEKSPKRADYIFDVIRSLRPHFLEAPRGVRRSGIDPAAPGGRPSMGAGGSAQAEVAVFVDGNHMGSIDVLKSIQAEQVEEVRYFDPSKAEAEFGLSLGAGGAIVIKLYKGKPPEGPSSPE